MNHLYRAATAGGVLAVISFVQPDSRIAAGPHAPMFAGIDSVLVTKEMLRQVLTDPRACASPDAGKGMWAQPPRLTQAGTTVILEDGRIVAMDREKSKLRVYSVDGREIALYGGAGAGPGELSALAVRSGAAKPWAGDTIVVYDASQARLMLYSGNKFARQIPVGEVEGLAGATYLGRTTEGLVFAKSFTIDPSINTTSRVRGETSLLLWKPGMSEPQTLRARVPSTDLHVVIGNGARSQMPVNFGHRTYFESVGNGIAIFDDATHRVEIIGGDGRVQRLITIGIPDPAVSREDRDSLSERLSEMKFSPALAEVRGFFPQTRSAVSAFRTDRTGGIWLAFAPPVAQGGMVYVRLNAQGAPDRCYRPAGDARVAGFSRDRVVTVTTEADADVINVERTSAVVRP